jgi:hypothetical protein
MEVFTQKQNGGGLKKKLEDIQFQGDEESNKR